MKQREKVVLWMALAFLFWGMAACGGPRATVETDCSRADAAGPQNRGGMGPAYGLMREFALALNEYNAVEKESTEGAELHFASTAGEILMPHKELLHQHALWFYNLLPQRTAMDVKDWWAPLQETEDVPRVVDELLTFKRAGNREVIRFFYGWDAAMLLLHVRATLYSKMFSFPVSSSVYVLGGFNVYGIERLNDDGENPILAIQSKHEFFSMSFRYDAAKGYYVPQTLVWRMKEDQRDKLQSWMQEEHNYPQTVGDRNSDADESNDAPRQPMDTWQLALSANDGYLSTLFSDKDETRYRRWRPQSRIRVGQSHLSQAAFSADGEYFLLMSENEATVRIYQTRNQTLIGNWRVEGFSPGAFAMGEVAFWPNTDAATMPRFLIGNEQGLYLYSATTGELVQQLNTQPVWKLLFSADGHYLLTVGSSLDAQISLVSVYERRPDDTLSLMARVPTKERVDSIALSKDNQLLAMGMYPSDTVTVIDLRSGTAKWTEKSPQYAASLDFSPDGTLLAMGGAFLVIFSVIDPALQATYDAFNNNINTVRFSPSGDAVAASAYDGRVRIVNTDIASGELKLLKALKHRGNANVYQIEFNRTGQRLISASGDQSAIIWGEQ